MLDPAICFKARMSRDTRFDGKFYTAVLTTGIFCRPVCPARAAKEENVRYFESAEGAQDAGFAPCKRCKPEHAPSQVMSLMARRMSERVLSSNFSMEQIASSFDLSERQFRRNFQSVFSLSPASYRQHHQLLLARKLILTTPLPMTDVCYAAGYNSIRRFNEQIKKNYGMSPKQMRKQEFKDPVEHITIRLNYRPPFDWQAMLRFFQLRQLPGIEHVDETSYQRSFSLCLEDETEVYGWFEVTQDPKEDALLLTLAMNNFQGLTTVINKVKRMFDLDADMSLIHQHLSQDTLLKPLVEKYKGIRLPGCWDIFEFTIRAILGQQISVKAATTLAGRIAEKYGRSLPLQHNHLKCCFPTLKDLVGADFSGLGLTHGRINTLEVWLAFLSQHPDVFEQYQDLAELEKQLTSLKGIGPWTVNYIAMRGLSDPNAFPASDLGVIKALASTLDPDGVHGQVNAKNAAKFKAKDIITLAEPWQPWRAYATIYLWLSQSD